MHLSPGPYRCSFVCSSQGLISRKDLRKCKSYRGLCRTKKHAWPGEKKTYYIVYTFLENDFFHTFSEKVLEKNIWFFSACHVYSAMPTIVSKYLSICNLVDLKSKMFRGTGPRKCHLVLERDVNLLVAPSSGWTKSSQSTVFLYMCKHILIL